MPCGLSFESFIFIFLSQFEAGNMKNLVLKIIRWGCIFPLFHSLLHGLLEFLNNNLIIKWILIVNTLHQRFQSCQLNKGRFLERPPVLKAWSSRGVQGHVPLRKISRYVPLTCHFLHFEITVNGNTVPNIITGSCLDDKRVKMAEKPLKVPRNCAKKTG